MVEAEGESSLSPLQEAFVSHYIGDAKWNATLAAKRAGYSAKTARQMGSENLSKPYIRARISARLSEIAMTADEVLERLAEQARGSMGDFVDAQGNFAFGKPSAKAGRHLIKKLRRKSIHTEFGIGEEIEAELYSAQVALEMIGRHHKLFTDKVESNLDGRSLDAVESLNSKLDGLASRFGAEGVSGEPDQAGGDGA